MTKVTTKVINGATKEEGCGHAVVERACTMVVDFSFISRSGRSKNTTVGGDERGIKSRCRKRMLKK